MKWQLLFRNLKDAIKQYPYLYAVASLLLLFLILLLTESVKNRHYRNGRTPSDVHPKKQPVSQMPKYAAGDEMDSLRNRTVYQKPTIPLPFVALVAIIAATFLIPYFRQPGIYAEDNQILQDENVLKDVTMDMECTFSSDYTKLFITSTYTNKGTITVYNIMPTIQILNDNNDVIQEKDGERIIAIPPLGQIEQTITIPLEVDIADIAHYRQEIHYRRPV